MNYHRLLLLCRYFSFLLVVLLAIACQSKQKEEGDIQEKYNVLFIAVDDLRPELAYYGKPNIISPNIDQLTGNGMLFERAYCQQAVCSPSRTSLLTGLRPDATKVYELQTHFRSTVPDVITLPQHFKQNGYYTVGLGKIYHNGKDDEKSWSKPHWYPESTRQYRLDENIKISEQHGRGPATEMADVPDTAYRDGIIADKAIEELRRAKDQPFFLAVGFTKPHLPFVAPKRYWDMYERNKIQLPDNINPPEGAPELATTNWGELRSYSDIPENGDLNQEQALQLIHGYYACISYIDAQVGKLLIELNRLGLRENTIVILWGDHGWKLGEYGDWSKHTNFELDTHSPLIVSAPEMTAKGEKTRALVEFVDIYPSLCELAGLDLPKHLQGSSFAPLLDDPEKEWKKAAFSQYPRGPFDEAGFRPIMGYSVRTDGYRFTRWQSFYHPDSVIAIELYDHQKDPGETINVADQPAYQKTVDEHAAILDQGWQAVVP